MATKRLFCILGWGMELINDIKECLETIPEYLPLGKGDTPWTSEICKRLVKLGKLEKYGFYTCAKGTKSIGGNHGEWLFDLSWLDYGTSDGSLPEPGIRILERLPLICESEWGVRLNELLDDFEKLVMANADLKLFIYQDQGADKDDAQKERLLDIVKAHGVRSLQHYMFCRFRWIDHGKWVANFFDGAGNDL